MVACWRIISFGANFGENSHHIDGHYCHVCTKPKSTSWNISMIPIFYNIFIGPIFLNILTVSKCWWFDHIDGTMFSGGEGPYCHIQECSTLFFLGCEHHRPCFRVLVFWLFGYLVGFLIFWLVVGWFGTPGWQSSRGARLLKRQPWQPQLFVSDGFAFFTSSSVEKLHQWRLAPHQKLQCTTSNCFTTLQTTRHTLPNYTENTVPCPTCLLWCLTINI